MSTPDSANPNDKVIFTAVGMTALAVITQQLELETASQASLTPIVARVLWEAARRGEDAVSQNEVGRNSAAYHQLVLRLRRQGISKNDSKSVGSGKLSRRFKGQLLCVKHLFAFL